MASGEILTVIGGGEGEQDRIRSNAQESTNHEKPGEQGKNDQQAARVPAVR
jgi:hypothetical protein